MIQAIPSTGIQRQPSVWTRTLDSSELKDLVEQQAPDEVSPPPTAPPPAVPSSPSTPDPLAADPNAVALEIRNNRVTVLKADGTQSAENGGAPTTAHSRGQAPQWLRHFLLPANYPSGIHQDYAPFRKWHAIGNVAAGGLEFFATQGLLAGLGLSGSVPAVATLAYFTKDALNSVGKFAGGALATRADANPGAWYFNSEAVNTVARVAQTGMIFVPGAFWVLAPVTNAAKAFGSAVQGAATVNIENHQSLGQNLGDMKTKNSNQDDISSGIGTGLGAGLSYGSQLIGLPHWTVPVFLTGLAAVNLYATHKAVNSLKMDQLSVSVLRSIARHQLQTDQIITPQDLQQEPNPRKIWRHQPDINLGVGLEKVAADPASFDRLRTLYGSDRYLLDFDGKAIHIALHPDATDKDEARAVYQAELLAEFAGSAGYQKLVSTRGEAQARWQAVQQSYQALPADFNDSMHRMAAAGWDTTRIVIATGGTRVRWKPLPAQPHPPLTFAQLRQSMN